MWLCFENTLPGHVLKIFHLSIFQLDAAIEAEKQATNDRALLALKKRKAQEELLKQVHGCVINVEQVDVHFFLFFSSY